MKLETLSTLTILVYSSAKLYVNQIIDSSIENEYASNKPAIEGLLWFENKQYAVAEIFIIRDINDSL